MRIVELVQDVVSVLLLPLYFAVSGLKTDLTLLDNATSWAICALTICAACLGKQPGVVSSFKELCGDVLAASLKWKVFGGVLHAPHLWCLLLFCQLKERLRSNYSAC